MLYTVIPRTQNKLETDDAHLLYIASGVPIASDQIAFGQRILVRSNASEIVRSEAPSCRSKDTLCLFGSDVKTTAEKRLAVEQHRQALETSDPETHAALAVTWTLEDIEELLKKLKFEAPEADKRFDSIEAH